MIGFLIKGNILKGFSSLEIIIFFKLNPIAIKCTYNALYYMYSIKETASLIEL